MQQSGSTLFDSVTVALHKWVNIKLIWSHKVHLPYKDDFSSFIHVCKENFTILYGYCLKPVQLFCIETCMLLCFWFVKYISSFFLAKECAQYWLTA